METDEGMGSHHISEAILDCAYQHAQQVEQHGKDLEQLASRLGTGIRFSPEQCKFIKAAGQQIQHHAQTMRALIEDARRDKERSTDLYVRASEEHVKAVELQVRVNSLLSQA